MLADIALVLVAFLCGFAIGEVRILQRWLAASGDPEIKAAAKLPLPSLPQLVPTKAEATSAIHESAIAACMSDLLVDAQQTGLPLTDKEARAQAVAMLRRSSNLG